MGGARSRTRQGVPARRRQKRHKNSVCNRPQYWVDSGGALALADLLLHKIDGEKAEAIPGKYYTKVRREELRMSGSD